jgi:hypothetical protein
MSQKKQRPSKVKEAPTTRQTMKHPTSSSTRDAGWAFIAVIGLVVLVCLVRLRVADVPLERDEGEYAYAGQLILQGIPPFKLVYNMKFPGTYYAYSAILGTFGQTPWAIHVGLMLVNIATVLVMFFLACRVLRNRVAAAASASAFAVLSLDRWIMGIFAHATHFVVLAAMAGLLVLLKALDRKSPAGLIIAGALLGTSVLMKQNGIFFLALGLGIAVGYAVWPKPVRLRVAAVHAGLLAAGSAIPFAAVSILFLAQGVFGRFWFWTVQYAKEYVSEMPLTAAWASFTSTLADITQANRPIWVLAAVGVAALWLVRWPADTRALLTAFLVVSLISICPGFYFREHYFILLLPAVALFAGVAVLSLQRTISRFASGNLAWGVAVSAFLVTLGMYAANEWNYFFSIPAAELSRMRYGPNPFVEAPEIARYVQANTTPADRIAILGSEPEIYFYSRRKSSTGYIYTYSLMEQQRYSNRMQGEMINEISADHPKYVIFVGVAASWLARRSDERILNWSNRYLKECYDLVGIADIQMPGPTKFVWDADVAGYQPRSKNLVYTFKSKTGAPCEVTR